MNLRIGHGYDIHSLVPGRRFVLAGVEIPSDLGPVGHSDGDALAHAIIDAIFGAIGSHDIGVHFPDTDEAWEGVAGTELLKRAVEVAEGWSIINIDSTIITETPKIAPYRETIREGIAGALGISVDRISVKAKTHEGHDAIGDRSAVAAHAMVLLEHRNVEDDTWL